MYKRNLLKAIGNVIGKIIKIDYNTDSEMREEFEQLLVSKWKKLQLGKGDGNLVPIREDMDFIAEPILYNVEATDVNLEMEQVTESIGGSDKEVDI
ncbi:hypothetical protein Goklo_023599, partial [Gossypium klotzschianum]|nr:hypothetical protein [Gossypium klotzschianum]